MLAAGILKLAGWDGATDFVDPMCGSGTLLIEAALIARNIYPGVFRKAFAFEKWRDFDRDLLDRIYNDDSQEREFHHKIYGYDLNQPAVDAAIANAKSAGVADCISVTRRPLQQFTQPAEPALMVTNPPYGERLVSPDLLGLYRTLGERLKHQFVGGEAWVITSREELFDQIGLKPSVRLPLFNGSLDCELRKYQVFSGKYQDFRPTRATSAAPRTAVIMPTSVASKPTATSFASVSTMRTTMTASPTSCAASTWSSSARVQDGRPRRDEGSRGRRPYEAGSRPSGSDRKAL